MDAPLRRRIHYFYLRGTTLIDFTHPEIIAVFLSSIGGIFGLVTLCWKKVIKPLVNLCKNQDYFVESVKEIRKELQTNGGSSLKDTIIELRETCNRIDNRQKVIEQRTKATLHYSESALFETDEDGRMIWSNANFYKFLPAGSSQFEGYDWLSIIHEDEREEVMQEFTSCLQMNRRFSKPTKHFDGQEIRLLGYPYRIDEDKHGGFLVSVTKT
tara:strand:+ start:109 stop:747 length:639 start_codon:yes stop_codon:yes gene_type:complete